ncbi:MAG: FIVAR domain-containing protein, partial [Clostridiales bacterium]|nr:FIVAR domain-containing protein [Clostridiales bacterium]
MKVHGKRSLALVTVATLLATSVVSTFTALAVTGDELIAAGYGKADGLNVHLAENEYYKEISSFDTGSGWTKHAFTSPDGAVSLDTGKSNSGSAALKMVNGSQQGGGNAVVTISNLQGLSITNADKASYIQFYAENVSDTDIELAKFPLNGAGAANTQQEAETKKATFLDLKTSGAAWTTVQTKASAIKLDGNNYQAIVLKANSKGLYRIPVSAWGNPATITRVMFWTHGAKDSIVYFDDLGLVAVDNTPVTPPSEPDKGMLNILKENAQKFLEREDEFTAESWTLYLAEYNKVMAMPEETQAEVTAKENALIGLADKEEELLEKKPAEPTDVPEGYTQTPGTHIHLGENEYYKELSGFETLNTDWNVHPWTKGEVISSTEHKNGGNAAVSATNKSVIGADGIGQENHRNILQVPLAGDKQDFTKAKYLQFYVENASDTEMEIAKIALETNGLAGQLQGKIVDVDALGAQFYDLKADSPSWKDATVAWSSARIDNSNESDEAHKNRYLAVVLPAGAKGMVRIPLTAWGGAGDLKAVKRVQFWTFIKTGGTAPATLYVDDLGLVGVLGDAPALALKDLETAKDAASKKAEKDYTAESWQAFQTALTAANAMPETTQEEVDAKTAAINAAVAKLVEKPIEEDQISKYTDKPDQNVYLNPGEKYKYIAGGEDNDINKIDLEHAFTKNQVSLVDDTKNSGAKGIKILQTNGDSQNAFHTVFAKICAEQKNWSDAKYLTFWVNNDQSNAKAVLELFYIQARTGSNDDLNLIDYDMGGIKFFDQRTGKWSDLEVMPNKQHRLPGDPNPDGTYKMVPSLQIPANAKGFVRIPLTNVTTEELNDVVRFQIFMATSGATGIYYVDDIGLVTYDGDTAPEYVDGEGDGTTSGGNEDNSGDNNGDGDHDDPIFDWGDDDENGDNN